MRFEQKKIRQTWVRGWSVVLLSFITVGTAYSLPPVTSPMLYRSSSSLTASAHTKDQNQKICLGQVGVEDELCMQIQWITGPILNEESQFLLIFSGYKKSLKSEVLPQVVLWMSHHGHEVLQENTKEIVDQKLMAGHGTSPVKVSPLVTPSGEEILGHYQVTEAYFIMRGPWEIKAQVILNGSPFDFTFNVDVP